ncbi:LysR family transcriptional regulator [Hydrogenophaga sp. UC242_53]|uniref:LysR family transcriptional regulator n=1 Tax=Hydrogenophaga sp. UC242_53 TaxID=3350170 RepID=UPI0036D29F8D
MSSETTAWTDKLKRMALFAEIVDSGSLSAAARRLGSTPSAVSQQLRLLEEALGLVLLHRSTRRLTLTEAGERYYPACAAMVAQARSADQALERLRDEPEGELRLAAPIGFGELLASALEPLRRHPRLRLHLLLDDTPIDLIGERVDLALRVGRFTDSSLVARRLGELQRQLCAAPRYLAERGWPRHPGELAGHDWLGLPPRGTAVDTLSFQGPQGEREEVRVEARLLASQVTALQAMALAGWGLYVGMADDVRQAQAERSACARAAGLAAGAGGGVCGHAPARRTTGQGAPCAAGPAAALRGPAGLSASYSAASFAMPQATTPTCTRLSRMPAMCRRRKLGMAEASPPAIRSRSASMRGTTQRRTAKTKAATPPMASPTATRPTASWPRPPRLAATTTTE